MNLSDATARLQAMTQYSIAPTLTGGEITALLTFAQAVDVDGRSPDDEDWVETYSPVMLNAAAAEGWLWKAAKLSERENFSADGGSFDPQARRAFCQEQATRYGKRVSTSAIVTGRASRYESIAGSMAVAN